MAQSNSYPGIRDSIVRNLFGPSATFDSLTDDQRGQAVTAMNQFIDANAGLLSGGAELWKQELAKDAQSAKLSNQSQDISKEMLDLTRQNQEENRKFVDETLVPRLGQADAAANNAAQLDTWALNRQGGTNEETRRALNALVEQQQGDAAKYNEMSGDLWDDYSTQQRALNAQDQGALSQYMRETDPLMAQRQAQGWGQDVEFDPYGYSSQQAALDLAQGAADGGLDYEAAQYGQSKAAQAFANAEDVAAQRGALGDIQRDIKTGGADQRAALDRIVQDLDTGGKNQQDVMERYKALTTPQATSQERFLQELARRQYETQMKSSRDAVMDNLAARGLRSGGAEIASMTQAGQQASQDRMLSELGIQAQAVGRSMDALQGYGTAANSLRAGQQQGLGLYSSGADALRASQQNALGQQADLSTALRNASFDEAYKRGSAADEVGMFDVGQTNTARADNQGTRMAGINQTGTMANQIRSSNDAIAMFNKTGSQTAQRFQDEYAQQEAERVGGLANQRQTATLNTTAQSGTRNQQVHDAGQDMLSTNYDRDKDTTDLSYKATGDIYKMDTDYNGMIADTGERAYDRTVRNLTGATGVANTRSGQASGDLDALIRVLQQQKGDIEAKRAEEFY